MIIFMSNYRPIAILPVFAKILEKIIYQRLYDFLQNKNILTDNQFGFRKKYSTSLAIFNLTESVLKEMEKGNFCIGLFMDLSKAFDTIDHHILLNKLEYYGVRGIDQFGFKSMASAIPGGLPRQTKDDAMPQAYTCS